MCVIAVCGEGKKLTKEIFDKCYDHNDHGAGFAWIANGKIHFAKGFMEQKLAWKVYERLCEYPHVAHFRLASAGKKCPELTHPFIVSPDSPIKLNGQGDFSVLFHNGTVSDWKSINWLISVKRGSSPKGEVSDSRVMAMAVAMCGDDNLSLDSGKFVIASPDGFKRFGTTSAGKDDWDEDGGIFFSNSFYKTSYVRWDKSDDWNEWYKDKHGIIVHNQGNLPIQLRGQNKNGNRIYGV